MAWVPLEKPCMIWHGLWVTSAGSTALCWCGLHGAGGLPRLMRYLLKLHQMHQNEVVGQRMLLKPAEETDTIHRRQREEEKATFSLGIQDNGVESWPPYNRCDHRAGTDPRNLEILCQRKNKTCPNWKHFWQNAKGRSCHFSFFRS